MPSLRPLFLTWDGPDQSYLEALFLPIFSRLRAFGIDVHVLQFSWAGAAQLEATRRAAGGLGVPYTSVRTLRRLGTAGIVADIARGAAQAVRYARDHAIDALFPRSLIPASMALLARRQLGRVDLVFDADGLMADERVDFVGWNPRGLQYRVLREVESQAVRLASSVIARTAAAKGILLARAGAGTDEDKILVVPNAKDAASFDLGTPESRAVTRARHGVPLDAPWLVYTGSLGPQYRAEAMVELFAAVLRRRPDARFKLFTFQEQLFRSALESRGMAMHHVDVGRAEPPAVAACLPAADLGVALRAEAFSQRAVCPIKVAEYLLSGLPVVSSRVGDLAAQLGERRVAFLLEDSSPPAIEAAADWFVQEALGDRHGFRERCRSAGEELFGLDRCVTAYRAAFERARN